MDIAAHLREAEEFLHGKIPLTRAMGLRVVPDESGFAIEAPVTLNSNHLQTAFGGSINSVATLAGYAFLWLELRGRAAHVIVRESSIRFLRPIHERLRAVCIPPGAQELATFFAAVQERRKARITLRVRLAENGAVAAEFVGTFVALPDAEV